MTTNSFKALKNSQDAFERLSKEASKLNKGMTFERDDFWTPELDKAGNGYAVIRFLPTPEVDGPEALPWVRIFHHAIKGPTGSWYIENSLTTLNSPDPVSEYNSKLWNSGIEEDKETARKYKRKLGHISNILVLEHPARKTDEGKVFPYRYGKKIFNKVNDAMHPQFPDQKPFNPFDFWAGANFKLKIRKVEGYSNYDSSEFAECKPLYDGDEKKLEELWLSLPSLQQYIAPGKFKSYDELKNKLYRVLGLAAETITTPTTALVSNVKPTPKVEVRKPAPVTESVAVEGSDADIEMFKRLAEED